MFSNAKVTERFEKLAAAPTLDQMMMTKIASDSIFASTPEREKGLVRLESVFRGKKEYWALQGSVHEAGVRSDGAGAGKGRQARL
jgi:hypothetical protein